MQILQAFLALALIATAGASPERLVIRFETAPGHFAGCRDDRSVAYNGTLMTVERSALVIDACPEYADCDRGATRRVEIESETLPDLRTLVAPQHRASFRAAVERDGSCAWELVVKSRGTSPRLIFCAARDVSAPRTAAVTVQRRAGKALHVVIEKGRAVRVAASRTVRSGGWLVHNVDGSAYWIAAAERE